jgi:hypothetical protein
MNTVNTFRQPPQSGRLGRLVCHERLLIRFLALGTIGAVVLLGTWTVGYLALAEGILRGRTAAAALVGEGAASSFWAEWARIASVNLVVGTLPVLANATFAYRGYPLGYLPPLLWAALYGVTLGTNSFTLPLSAPMAPSLAVFGRSGIYEIAAYTLVAVSTHTLPRHLVTRFIPPTSQPCGSWTRSLLNREQWLGIFLAIALLLAANAWEALGIVSIGGTS